MDQQSHLVLPLKNGFSARPFREGRETGEE